MAQILIANDNCDLLECCRAILEADGHAVEIVADGEEAVILARARRPDAVVIDWVMPRADGPAAIAALRADPATKDIPILLMSGTEDGEASSAEIGADAFLRKPFMATDLSAAVERLLQGAERQERTVATTQ
jgi:DNA-binding response OmpR family regulator